MLRSRGCTATGPPGAAPRMPRSGAPVAEPLVPSPDAAGAGAEGAGELARRVAELDWARTPLGPAPAWPAGLSTAVRILLTSRFSMWMAWGPELTMLYNDAYWRGTLRGEHPWGPGGPARGGGGGVWGGIRPRGAARL